MKLAVLVAEDDALVRLTVGEALASAGHAVETVADGQSAVVRLSEARFDVVISDVWMPKLSGLGLFQNIKRHSPATSVILITAHGTVNDAVDSLKAGVDDYVTKPFDVSELLIRVERLGERQRVNHELREARASLAGAGLNARLIGRSQVMLSLMQRVQTIAPTDASLLIVGESGTGKELVARTVHEASARAAGPFVAVNCAAVPEALVEAELFGRAGGALEPRAGRLEVAHGGTLFLDEVGEIPLSVQAKLLEVLGEGSVEPLGSNRTVPLDVRIICATHRNLKQMVAAGTFRQDLYYRINVLDISVPPLRQRRMDLPLLVSHFYRRFAKEGSELRMRPRAWAALMHHSFPGNVRELEHAIRHAVVLARGSELDLGHLPSDIAGGAAGGAGARAARIPPLAESIKDFERHCLIAALNATNGTKFKAANLLGISRKTLWEKLKVHRITDSNLEEEDELGPGSERELGLS
jgi:DNA-binding NtrC family response regulator